MEEQTRDSHSPYRARAERSRAQDRRQRRSRHPHLALSHDHNLKGQPEATVQIKDRKLRVRAEEARGEERNRLWDLVVAKAPFFADYRKKVQREIPLMILRPEGSA